MCILLCPTQEFKILSYEYLAKKDAEEIKKRAEAKQKKQARTERNEANAKNTRELPTAFRRMTGLSKESFLAVYDFLGGDQVCSHLKYNYKLSTPLKKNKKKIDDLSLKDRLLITILRLRRGYSVEELALFFNISKSLAGDIFFVWVQHMYLQFYRLKERMFTTRAAQPKSKLPSCLKMFPGYRTTIDTTDIRIQVPYHYQQQGNTYSEYKAGNIIKYLAGVNCWGACSFISQGFEGNASDVEMFKNCGMIEMLQPGDVILGDRGFTVEELLDPLLVKLVHPPFLKGRQHFTAEEEILTKYIAAARIHVERFFRKLKCFLILKSITNNMLPILDQIVFVCACLVNFDPPNM